jgi:predicted transcriptional regulator
LVKRTVKVTKNLSLSDEQLENLMQARTIVYKYGKKVATRKNFETQLAGLEIIDNKYNLGIFGTDEWNEIVLECDEYYPETDAVKQLLKQLIPALMKIMHLKL